MAYDIPADIRQSIQAHVDSGAYQNEDDVLRTALHLLSQRETNLLETWNQKNLLAQEQSKLGLSMPLEDEAILQRLRDRLAQEGITE